MKQKKLLILFWDLDIGGIQIIIRDLVVYLHNVHPNIKVYILLKHNKDSHIAKEIQKKARATIYSPDHMSNSRIINHLFFFVWVSVLYLKLNPDVCLTFLDTLSMFAVSLRKLFFWKKVRIVLNENVVTSKNNIINKHPVWFWNWCVSFFYKYADVIIVPSNACRTDLVSVLHIPERIVRIGRNWTLLPEVTQERKINDLIYVGRFEKEKNTPALIELVQSLRLKRPRIMLCMVGKGSEESKLKKMVIDRNVHKNVIFTGYQKDIGSYLRKSKVFVTTTNNEGVPLTILEAGSQGLPCVTRRFSGAEEIIQHGKTGFIADTPSEMYVYINMLLKNSSLRKEMGSHAQKFIHLQYGLNCIRTFVKHLRVV